LSEQDRQSPVERRIQRSFEDTGGVGKPLTRRARQTKRSVEAYLKAGVLPRYMERARQIERDTAALRDQIGRAYAALREECAGDPQLFARLWTARARSWRFGSLPMDPRTRDYVRVRGRSYRREPLDAAWVLREFPPVLG
jgi:hypothetical protein